MNSSEASPPAPWWRVMAVGRNPRVTLIRLLVLAGLTVFAFREGFFPVRVTGISMLPGFRDGERRWISPMWARFNGLHRGDVVAIRTSGRQLLYLKRIVGLPGERVRIRKGEVLINDEPLSEPYVAADRARWNWPTNGMDRALGSDEFFVVGDNRGMPAASHYFGIAERKRILGKLIR